MNASDELNGYVPTCELRFVKRLGVWAGPGAPNKALHILQQKWISAYIGEPDIWRDVPTVELEP